MTGLEKIIKQIEDDAAASAAAVLEDAENQAFQIRQDAKVQGAVQGEETINRAKDEAKAMQERTASAAALQKRKSILAAKQQIIGETMERALQAAVELPPEEYFSNILKMVKKYALPQDGEILFNQKDLQRLPGDFAARLEKTAPTGAKLTLSKETRNIDGGFVLTYGGIEQNCSFSALFDAAKEGLQDEIHALLFPGGH